MKRTDSQEMAEKQSWPLDDAHETPGSNHNQEGIISYLNRTNQVTIMMQRKQKGSLVPGHVPPPRRGHCCEQGRQSLLGDHVPQSRLSVLPQSDCVIKGGSLVPCSLREKKAEEMESDST